MGIVDGGALVGKALANAGITKAFVLCGEHIMPILYGMRSHGIEIIDTRHECAAIYAAIAYTRASGKPAVVVTTAGPGVANTAAGMMEAQAFGVPLIHIGGAVKSNKRDAGDLQDMDTLELMAVCSKWARKLTRVERVPEYISLAHRHAIDSRSPGPVYLEMPIDLVYQETGEDEVVYPAAYHADAIPFGDPALIEEAAGLLANAKRPAAVIDDGARFNIGNHAGSVADLSDYLQMPVTDLGVFCRGLFGNEIDNPLLACQATDKADVVLALGCRFDWRAGMGENIAKDAKLIQVHTDSRLIGFNVRVDVGIVGGAGPVASQLVKAVKSRRPKPASRAWVNLPVGRVYENLPGAYHSEGTPMHPARCAGEVIRFLSEEGRDWDVIRDGGEAGAWLRLGWRATRPGQLHGTGANGTIGTGAALAIGAWVANRKPVLWYTGDGSFGFHAMELDTMARLGIPVVCVISNDSAWGMIRLRQGRDRPDEIAKRGHANTELAPGRAYEKIVSMWGGHGEAVTDPREIIPAIQRSAANAKPSIINVQVDRESMSPMLAGHGALLRADK